MITADLISLIVHHLRISGETSSFLIPLSMEASLETAWADLKFLLR